MADSMVNGTIDTISTVISNTAFNNSDATLPPTVIQLHRLCYPLSFIRPLIQPVQEKLLPYTNRIDLEFEKVFGPIHPYSSHVPLNAPHNALFFIIMYFLLVLLVMPIFRALRFKVSLKPIMRLYNAFMVVLSAYMCIQAILLARESNSTLFCVPMATGGAGARMTQLVWIFTYSKVLEFLDTVFMVFEGRYRQVSFLHVYHHFTILTYWFAILWTSPGSDSYFSLAGNSFIHVLMYSYYLLASFGYSPWWKYYITKMQILQFICFCTQSIYVGYIMTEKRCHFPNILSRALLWYMISLIALFAHFLATNKRSKKTKSKTT